MSLLPIKSKIKGAAPSAPDDADDILDEAIATFRANVLFASFDIQGGADRLLAYLTLYIQQCLCRLDAKGKTKADGTKIMIELAREAFPLPGETGWMLGGHFPTPKARAEADQARNYLKHVREEIGMRLVDAVYNADGTPNKFWMAFSKKKFMNIPMS
jgi:actin related protein 2/3 complex, subunit 3